jgi:hypothetical protein
MPEPLISVATTGFVAGAAGAVGHRCGEHIADALEETAKSAEKAWNEGWERDYEAGGISSWGSESNEEVEPA